MYILMMLVFFSVNHSEAQKQHKARKRDPITYFQTLNQLDTTQTEVVKASPFQLLPGTEVGIVVSSMNNEADVVFNPFLTTGKSGNSELKEITGYQLDEEGNIEFPLIGKVNFLNLTTRQAAEALKEKLKKHINNPFVTVRVLNFQVTVLGEVSKPAVLSIHKERITVPEVISMAGDLTIYGKRDNVLVVREISGKREFGVLNLNDRSLFQSPYYFLKPNDIIYVEPLRSKKLLAGKLFPWVPTILSGMSLITFLVVNLLR
ncbi:polysaccharide biosynthesis/export family protein [Nibrella viscosa]|uniref:Polysaccharide biosynthesis/export family protein n=2 Tax=Nibrella viscosa TaxID=1084524 RepID=A0ABP8KGI1_9BACT